MEFVAGDLLGNGRRLLLQSLTRRYLQREREPTAQSGLMRCTNIACMTKCPARCGEHAMLNVDLCKVRPKHCSMMTLSLSGPYSWHFFLTSARLCPQSLSSEHSREGFCKSRAANVQLGKPASAQEYNGRLASDTSPTIQSVTAAGAVASQELAWSPRPGASLQSTPARSTRPGRPAG